MGGEGDIFVMQRSTIIGLHTIAPPRLWVVSQFEILATPITRGTGTGSVSDCGVIRPAPGSSASEMGTWGEWSPISTSFQVYRHLGVAPGPSDRIRSSCR